MAITPMVVLTISTYVMVLVSDLTVESLFDKKVSQTTILGTEEI